MNEKRLIDASSIKYRTERECGGHGIFYDITMALKEDIDALPTVDAVEVVRCKECKSYDPGYIRRDHGWCKEWGTAVRASGFCHHGERRTDG